MTRTITPPPRTDIQGNVDCETVDVEVSAEGLIVEQIECSRLPLSSNGELLIIGSSGRSMDTKSGGTTLEAVGGGTNAHQTYQPVMFPIELMAAVAFTVFALFIFKQAEYLVAFVQKDGEGEVLRRGTGYFAGLAAAGAIALIIVFEVLRRGGKDLLFSFAWFELQSIVPVLIVLAALLSSIALYKLFLGLSLYERSDSKGSRLIQRAGLVTVAFTLLQLFAAIATLVMFFRGDGNSVSGTLS